MKDEPHVVRNGPGARSTYFWLKFSPKYLAVDGGAERGRDFGEDARLRDGEGEGALVVSNRVAVRGEWRKASASCEGGTKSEGGVWECNYEKN